MYLDNLLVNILLLICHFYSENLISVMYMKLNRYVSLLHYANTNDTYIH